MKNIWKYKKYIEYPVPTPGSKIYNHIDKHLTDKLELINGRLLIDPPLMSFSIKSHIVYGKIFSRKDVPLLRLFAKIFRVKMMWVKSLDSLTLKPIQTISIIGEEERVYICEHWLKCYLSYEKNYREWVKLTKREEFKTFKDKSISISHKTIRSYSSSLIDNLRKTIITYIEKLLEYDIPYILWLEDMVKIHSKLDYKAYKTDKHEYYHAISLIPHHRRMII